MQHCVAVCLVLYLVGCTSASKTSAPSQKADATSAPNEAAPAQGFMPAGGNPEVALDTQKGTLCRTSPATPRANDKYASLPMCASPSSSAVSVAFAWDKAVRDAPLEASCYLAKDLLPSYSASTPPTMQGIRTSKRATAVDFLSFAFREVTASSI
jgi:hypothetical protein